MDDKENTAPTSALLDNSIAFDLPILEATKKGRSKSVGPGGNNTASPRKENVFDRRRSAYTPAVKGIIPDKEDAERKAARRKSMANRRVSFAPEATLHTWDVIDHLREHTNSTNSSDTVRRSPRLSPSRQESSPFSPEPAEESESGSEESEDDAEEEAESLEEATGTMSSIADDRTEMTSASNNSSTSSSAQLERNLRMAAEAAGTRGIEYDEYGDMSMEMAEDEITNAFQPWADREAETNRGLAAFDQENVDPFQGAEKLQAYAPMYPLSNAGNDTDDTNLSMDFTHATGKVLYTKPKAASSSPATAEATMEFTRVVGSAYQQNMTEAVGNVKKRGAAAIDQNTESPSTSNKRRRSSRNESASRMSFASIDENEDMSMELTTVLGGIRAEYTYDQPQILPNASHRPPSVDPAYSDSAENKEHDTTPTPKQVTNTEVDHDATPIAARSSNAQSGSSSPGRRTSARLNKVLPTPVLQTVIGDSERLPKKLEQAESAVKKHEDSTIAVQHNDAVFLGATPKSPLTRRASASPNHAQSSPFQSVAASPAPMSMVRSRQAMRETASPVPARQKIGHDITDSIKIMSTPRKETLKSLSPKKRTPSPKKARRSSRRAPSGVLSSTNDTEQTKPVATVSETSNYKLQTFLDEAGIRFMDLTTSKRRATIAPTPSKMRKLSSGSDFDAGLSETIALDDAIISAACTEPELELYKHACNELRRYIDGGKADIKTLEESTLSDTPELIRLYMTGTAEHRAMTDAKLRDIKVHARLRSKEMWYSWRSNLVDDLMKVLQSIAEGLLNDDDILQERENTISKALPTLLEQRTALQTEAEALQATNDSVPAEQREELDAVRMDLQSVAASLEEKRRMSQELQKELATREDRLLELNKHKDSCMELVRKADHVKAASQINTAQDVAILQSSINKLESMSGWKLLSSTATPPTVTMSYKSELEFFFHPLAFMAAHPNATQAAGSPMSLRYTGASSAIPTCERFFLQLLRAQLQAQSHGSVPVNAVLGLISTTWDMAQAVAEASRCMSIERPTKTLIFSDERLQIVTSILMPETQSKVAATINLLAVVRSDREIDFVVGSDVKIVYGRTANHDTARKQFSESTAAGPSSWQAAIIQLEDTLRTANKKTKASK